MNTNSPQYVQEIDQGFGNIIEIKEVLCDCQSDFQHIQIFETAELGKMMMLDGIVQFTEFDEFAYQEMMTHPAMMVHPNPEKVLIIGGGDGGVAREVAKHQCVKEIHQCEIDGMVVEMCKKFVPSMSCGFDDPRMHLVIGDGLKFVSEHKNEFDVIIVDSTDPGGPGEPLFGEAFYGNLKKALKPGGVIGTQAESYFLLPEIAQRVVKFAGTFFKSYGFAQIHVPTYPTGVIGCCVASDEGDVREPKRFPDEAMQKKLRYYTPEVHRGAFMLPGFARELFEK